MMQTGLNFLEPVLTALKLDSVEALQIVHAATVARMHHPPLEPGYPALVTRLSNPVLVAQVKKTVQNAYPNEMTVTLATNAGATSERVWQCYLAELDHQAPMNESTVLYLPPLPQEANFTTFQETVAHLRAPEGCPWDREQTHQSLRPYLLEETYEVLEALDAGDSEALAEELGDLLLQVVLHTQIAIEQGEFKMSDVLMHINRKLWRRHPHVFGDVVVNSVEEVTTNWEAIKKAEKAQARNGETGSASSALDGAPAGLPALAQAMAISKKAARVGFEWPNIKGVLDKIIEEAREITQANTLADLEAEIGDLLFSVVNLARWKNVDAESALRAANARFVRRFKKLEALAAARGRPVEEMSIDEMDALWTDAKRYEVEP